MLKSCFLGPPLWAINERLIVSDTSLYTVKLTIHSRINAGRAFFYWQQKPDIGGCWVLFCFVHSERGITITLFHNRNVSCVETYFFTFTNHKQLQRWIHLFKHPHPPPANIKLTLIMWLYGLRKLYLHWLYAHIFVMHSLKGLFKGFRDEKYHN